MFHLQFPWAGYMEECLSDANVGHLSFMEVVLLFVHNGYNTSSLARGVRGCDPLGGLQ